jgi:alkanesulfonate monooxygenase SsuD/methylene tetrahydromethanopterin reductase-like flavin-dependent oxidoreductase (luciferase family)
MGGDTPKARQRVVDFCNGWMPIGIRSAGILAGMKDLAERARAAGKDPKDFPTSVFGAPADADTLKQYADAGVERAIFWVPPDGREKVLPLIDKYAAFVR